MKKVLAILVILVLMSSFAAIADTGSELSAALINLTIEATDETWLFDLDKSAAYVDDDGDVVVMFECTVPYVILNLLPGEVHRRLSETWAGLNAGHKLLASCDLYLCFTNEGDIMYYTGGLWIIDFDGVAHSFVKYQ